MTDNTEFMVNLIDKLKQERKVSDSTANAYVRALRILNDSKPFKTLMFLKKTDEIIKKIEEKYKPSTQLTLYSTLTAVLFLFKDKMNKAYETYKTKMETMKGQLDKKDTAEMSETQKENWMSKDEVEKIKKELDEKVESFEKKKTLTDDEFNTLLNSTVLSLYTDIPPRRNQDYALMKVKKVKKDEELSKDSNWLTIDSKKKMKFIFNKYKTAWKDGQNTVDVPADLSKKLTTYLRFHPSRKEKEYHLLVNKDGKELTAVNSITRILNKVFGKKIGPSMLRHIFITEKYGRVFDEQQADASAMSHTIAQQRKYRLKKKDAVQSIDVPTISDESE